MAVESDIISLLFSMTGMRSLYMRYTADPNNLPSLQTFSRQLQTLFPSASQQGIVQAASHVITAYQAGWNATHQLGVLQNQLPGVFPVNLSVGGVAEATDLLDISSAPYSPLLTVPGIPNANYIVNTVIGIDDGTAAGTTYLQAIFTYVNTPDLQTYTTDILDYVVVTAGMSKYGLDYDNESPEDFARRYGITIISTMAFRTVSNQ